MTSNGVFRWYSNIWDMFEEAQAIGQESAKKALI